MSGLNLTLHAETVPFAIPLPSNSQALVNFIAMYTSIMGGGAFNGINFGANTPAPQNRGLPWFQTDAMGNPIGLFSWNGSAWVAIPSIVPSGPTANYPTNPANGQQFYDTSIGALVLFNSSRNAWTTASGVPGDIKEVATSTLAQALTNNPGWIQEPSSIGCVIGAAGDATGITAAHPQGSKIGEEAHTLAVTEIPAHSHQEIYGTSTGQYQNGSQAAGVFPAVTPGSTSTPFANTNNTGGGQSHNNIQPTIYFWRLLKSY